MPVVVDVETKSHADLPKVGAAVYAQHPSTEIICLCYGIDNEPIQEWWPGKKVERGIPWHGSMPTDLYMAIMSGHEIEAHNVSFEYSIWRWILAERHGWLMPYPHSWRDTMAAAAYYALPMKLDKLAAVLGFQGKDPAGDRLITKYSKLHLKTAKADIPPEDFRRFVDYCKKDVRIEQSVSDFLGDLPERETKIFLMDQAINRRGMLLDARGIDAASEVVDKRAEELTARFRQITNGINPTQRDKVIAWCAEHGVALENLQAEYLGELLESDELPGGPVRRALEIRLRISKASTKKLDAMARNRGPDGRARFQTRYHGTSTGRTSATGFQPLNMNRGFEYENKPGAFTPEDLIRDIYRRSPQWLDMLYGDATDAIGKATRHWVCAEEGSRIISGDFVSIEAIVIACLAGEDWKVEAFRSGAKIYELMADKIYKLPPGTVTKKTHPLERQDGKIGELSFSYQGALGAWLKFDSSGRHSDEAIIDICKAWRAEHPAIVDFWYGLEEAALSAVNAPGQYFDYQGVGFEIVDEWLTMILLNGKRLWYWKPELRTVMPRWHQPAVKEDCRNGTCRCRPKPQITYMAQKEGQWKRISTYSGKLAENCVQAHAREILKSAELRVHEAWTPPLRKRGYIRDDESALILDVYDELVAEVPEDFGSVEEFAAMMKGPAEDWYADWPINVDVWTGKVYRK